MIGGIRVGQNLAMFVSSAEQTESAVQVINIILTSFQDLSPNRGTKLPLMLKGTLVHLYNKI